MSSRIPSTIEQNLTAIDERIRVAISKCHRNRNDIEILAVSKGQDIQSIKAGCQAGLAKFGESYLQEALPKIKSLQSLGIEWHFIGPIQANKTRQIAENFHWVHSIDRLKIASRLDAHRPEDLPALNICIQINLDLEQSKSGLIDEAVFDFASQLSQLKQLKLRGLMAIPQKTDNRQQQRIAFSHLRHLFDDLNQHGYELDTLSMGMSNDLEAAIVEGATILRIGTALFGARHDK